MQRLASSVASTVARRGMLLRPFVASGVSLRSFSLFRDPATPAHRSDAQVRVNEVPVILVHGTVAVCDGGGGATGHPIEYIQLDKREGNQVEVCKYCGLRYQMASHHTDVDWSNVTDDLPAGRLASLTRPSAAAAAYEAGRRAGLLGSPVAPPVAPAPAPAAKPKFVSAPQEFKAGKRKLKVSGHLEGDLPVTLDLHLKDDRVTITNITDAPMPLANWVLLSETGSQMYDFPKKLTLQPGEDVTIWSGKHADKHHNPPKAYKWTKRHIWNDKGDKAILVNADGVIVDAVEKFE